MGELFFGQQRVALSISWLLAAVSLSACARVAETNGGGDAGAPAPDAAPGGPTAGHGGVTAVTGVTGFVQLNAFGFGGYFFEDDTILRAAAAPECVAHLRSQTKPPSPAGTFTVSTELTALQGGPPGPLVVEPSASLDTYNQYFADAGEFLESTDAGLPTFDTAAHLFPPYPYVRIAVQASLTGSFVFPGFPATTLYSAGSEIVVTAPAFSDAELEAERAGLAPLVLEQAKTQPLVVMWDALGTEAEAVVLWVSDLGTGETSTANLFCRWASSAGHGVVPAELLTAVRDRLGGLGAATGNIEVTVGDAREIAEDGSSYFIYTFQVPNLLGDECGLFGPPCSRGFSISSLRLD